MKLQDSLNQYLDTIYQEAEFIERTYTALNHLGFTSDNTIACVGVCRDEISQSLVELANRSWGYTFNLSSLGGIFLAGRTALSAAMHHSPDLEGRERYVFYNLPHIAIDADGRIGVCSREGRRGESTACGALNAFHKELTAGRINTALDFGDLELSLIKTRLLKELSLSELPDLLELTRIAQKASEADLGAALRDIIHTDVNDYALITGIQINALDGNYVCQASGYAVVGGIKHELELG